MNAEDIYLFGKLKEAIVAKYREKNPDGPADIREWNMKVMDDFQEDLLAKAKGRVSTKWIYTHLKSDDAERLPRIDVLNLLSRYAGYDDWDDFAGANPFPDESTLTEAEKQQPKIEFREGVINLRSASKLRRNKAKLLPLVFGIMGGVLILIFAFAIKKSAKKHTYKLCVADMYFGKPVPGSEVLLLVNSESPVIYKCDTAGCCTIETPEDKIRLVIKAPYYKADTISRTLSEVSSGEIAPLVMDDYAMMINIFSRSDRKDWEKRRARLGEMFTDDVQIFQVQPEGEAGMEMYNKQEFIDKMTMPVHSLRNIEVLETKYQGNKINAMRFVQKDKN